MSGLLDSILHVFHHLLLSVDFLVVPLLSGNADLAFMINTKSRHSCTTWNQCSQTLNCLLIIPVTIIFQQPFYVFLWFLFACFLSFFFFFCSCYFYIFLFSFFSFSLSLFNIKRKEIRV